MAKLEWAILNSEVVSQLNAEEKQMAIDFHINGRYEAPADTPMLWVIREQLKLTGTKFRCGAGLCGARVVYIDGEHAFSFSNSDFRGRRARRSDQSLSDRRRNRSFVGAMEYVDASY